MKIQKLTGWAFMFFFSRPSLSKQKKCTSTKLFFLFLDWEWKDWTPLLYLSLHLMSPEQSPSLQLTNDQAPDDITVQPITLPHDRVALLPASSVKGWIPPITKGLTEPWIAIIKKKTDRFLSFPNLSKTKIRFEWIYTLKHKCSFTLPTNLTKMGAVQG